MARINFSMLLLFSTLYVSMFAQPAGPDTMQVELNPIMVSATRLGSRFESSVLPVTVIQPRLVDNTGISLHSMICGMPGVFVMNANNYAQDLRISIRGFGARSAFGIRGIRIVVDGIPETTPDGQGQLDNLDLYAIGKVEIVRGAASSLYGNASGGVIYISSMQDVDSTFAEVNAGLGSFGLRKLDAIFGYVGKKNKAILHGSHAGAEGYREQSGFENNVFQMNWTRSGNKNTRWAGIINYTDAPRGDDAGGLNQEEVAANRRQARDVNVIYQAGESIRQLKGSLSFDKDLGGGAAIRLYGFGNGRSFEGRLPLKAGGWVGLQRVYYGQGGYYALQKIRENRVENYQLGYDVLFQKDDRIRFDNLEGVKGDRNFDQSEQFNNQAVFALAKWTFPRWFAEQSLRADFNQMINTDHFLEDGDDSGMINLSNVSFSSGLGFFVNSQVTLVARYGTAFETPALSELSANPTGGGGFNESLLPQSSATLEFGLKGHWRRHWFDLTWFDVRVKDEILSYELEAFPGRTFYRNSGITRRSGVELAHSRSWNKKWTTRLSYTFSDLKFERYLFDGTDLAGLKLPGIPRHMFSWQIDFMPAFVKVNLKGQHYSQFWAENLNTVEVEHYALIDLSLYRTLKTNKFEITPYLHIENVWNADYFDNIRINAFGGRYYEPGPGRQFRIGVKFRI
ncbi:MAG: TonB-dependent receptor [Saprospiraceae bacterium]|nr:TonB-dependent receptor [Saprospiraceae bacterium]